MSDYISREAVIADIEQTIENSGCVNHESEIIDCVRYATAADVVEVVRCRDCRFYATKQSSLCDMHHRAANAEDYCSYGVSKESSARWETKDYPDEEDGQEFNMEFYVCTNCGKKVFFNFQKTTVCPACGARMDAKEDAK